MQNTSILDMFEEALEDIVLAQAIEEGMQSPLVNREEVFKLFKNVEPS